MQGLSNVLADALSRIAITGVSSPFDLRLRCSRRGTSSRRRASSHPRELWRSNYVGYALAHGARPITCDASNGTSRSIVSSLFYERCGSSLSIGFHIRGSRPHRRLSHNASFGPARMNVSKAISDQRSLFPVDHHRPLCEVGRSYFSLVN